MSNNATSTIPWAKPHYSPASPTAKSDAFTLPAPNMDDLLRSYATQWYRISLRGGSYALRHRDPDNNPWREAWPTSPFSRKETHELLPAGFIVGTWHPDGAPIPLTEQPYDDRETLISTITRFAEAHDVLGVSTAVTLDRDSSWIEHSLMFLFDSDDRDYDYVMKEAMHLFGQTRCVEINYVNDDNNEAPQLYSHVVSLEIGGGLSRELPSQMELIPLPQEPCPMSVGYQIYDSPERVGGPYGSRAMTVAAEWQHHYDLTHLYLACTPCSSSNHARELSKQGGPVSLYPIIPASRYGHIHRVKK